MNDFCVFQEKHEPCVLSKVEKSSVDDDIQRVFRYQRDHLEKTVNSLKMKLAKSAEEHEKVYVKIMKVSKHCTDLRRQHTHFSKLPKVSLPTIDNRVKEIHQQQSGHKHICPVDCAHHLLRTVPATDLTKLHCYSFFFFHALSGTNLTFNTVFSPNEL